MNPETLLLSFRGMFGIFFAWSKASKCKSEIKRTRYRLRLLKNKRQAIATQLRKDLAELIQSGYEQAAFNRVEQLMEDESMTAAYELLDHFCEFILKQLSHISKHKTRDCPSDINEAISSLIFASARCGDVPELCVIRKLFAERYGQKFATIAVNLLPGNLVNKKLKDSLSIKSIPDDVKYRVVDEIAKENCFQQQISAIEWKQVEVEENKGCQLVESDAKINDTISGSKVYPLEIEETKKHVNFSIPKPSDSCYPYAIVTTIQQYPPYSPLQNKVQKSVVVDFPMLISSTNSSLQKKEERLALTSSPESISINSYPEEMAANINDNEEYQFSLLKNGATQFGSDQSDVDQEEPQRETSSTRFSRRSKRAQRKRSIRRSISLEKLGIMDNGYMTYYQKPSKSISSPLTPSKHLHSSHNQDNTRRKTCNIEIGGCSLDQPCYCCLYDNEDCLETQSNKLESGNNRDTDVQQEVLIDEFCHCQPFWDDEMNKGMELVTIQQKPNGKSYGIHCEVGNGSNDIKAKISASSSTRIEIEAPYTRAMTMPIQRHMNCKDMMFRTFSCPSPCPTHVHPKLPDYDDLVAKFNALKRDHQENNDFRES